MNKVKTNIHTYIDEVQFKDESLSDIITVEHRLNNPKRDFLFVNKVQGKHIPTKPSDMLNLVESLAYETMLCDSFDSDKPILVVGFCETATFIGEQLAEIISVDINKKVYYMQTTRESLDKSKLFNFEEEHSHAVDESIYIEDADEVNFEAIKTVILVDDEISTGNTMVNFYNEMKSIVPNANYIVASICNWQNDADAKRFSDNHIDRVALIFGKLKDAKIKMGTTSLTDRLKDCRCKAEDEKVIKTHYPSGGSDILYEYVRCGHWKNNTTDSMLVFAAARFVAYQIANEIQANFGRNAPKSVKLDIIGTEELMYLPYKIADTLEKRGFDVTFHATTRSPIDISKESIIENGGSIKTGLVTSYKVRSPYDKNRDTFVYNLDSDRYTIVITDASDDKFSDSLDAFAKDLVEAFRLADIREYKIVKL